MRAAADRGLPAQPFPPPPLTHFRHAFSFQLGSPAAGPIRRACVVAPGSLSYTGTVSGLVQYGGANLDVSQDRPAPAPRAAPVGFTSSWMPLRGNWRNCSRPASPPARRPRPMLRPRLHGDPERRVVLTFDDGFRNVFKTPSSRWPKDNSAPRNSWWPIASANSTNGTCATAKCRSR